MKEFVIYTLLRFGLFFACFVVTGGVWVLTRGVEGLLFWPVLMAVVISLVLSVRLLAGPRERFALVVQGRAERGRERFEQMKAREDADDESEPAGPGPGPGPGLRSDQETPR